MCFKLLTTCAIRDVGTVGEEKNSSKDTERELQEGEDRHRLLFEQSPIAIGITVSDGIVIVANKTKRSSDTLKRIDRSSVLLACCVIVTYEPSYSAFAWDDQRVRHFSRRLSQFFGQSNPMVDSRVFFQCSHRGSPLVLWRFQKKAEAQALGLSEPPESF